MEDKDAKAHGLLLAIFSMVMPTLAIIVLALNVSANGYTRNEKTLWTAGLSCLLAVVGIVAGGLAPKSTFVKLAIGFGIVTVLLALVGVATA